MLEPEYHNFIPTCCHRVKTVLLTCLRCSSSPSLSLLSTYQDSWSLLSPVRVSCHLSSSPKVSCSRMPSRWVAHGSPQCCPQGAQVLGKCSLSTALGRSHSWALPHITLRPAHMSLRPCSPPDPPPLASSSPLSSSSPLPSVVVLPDSLKIDVARLVTSEGTVGGTVSTGQAVLLGMLTVV